MHIAVFYGGLSQVPAAFKLTLVEVTEMASRRHLTARGCGLMHEARPSGRPYVAYVKVPCRREGRARESNANSPAHARRTQQKHQQNNTMFAARTQARWSVAFADLYVPRVLGSTPQRGRHTASIVSSVHTRVMDENPAVESFAVAQQTSAGNDQIEAQCMCKAGPGVVPADSSAALITRLFTTCANHHHQIYPLQCYVASQPTCRAANCPV